MHEILKRAPRAAPFEPDVLRDLAHPPVALAVSPRRLAVHERDSVEGESVVVRRIARQGIGQDGRSRLWTRLFQHIGDPCAARYRTEPRDLVIDDTTRPSDAPEARLLLHRPERAVDQHIE